MPTNSPKKTIFKLVFNTIVGFFTKQKTILIVGFFPQQRKLMGSSAQISSGVCRCGSEEQVPEEGSRRFRRDPVCAGVGSGGRFRRVSVCAGVGFGGRFRRVPVCAGVGSGGNFWKAPEGPVFRKVQESSCVVCCLATLTGAAM